MKGFVERLALEADHVGMMEHEGFCKLLLLLVSFCLLFVFH